MVRCPQRVDAARDGSQLIGPNDGRQGLTGVQDLGGETDFESDLFLPPSPVSGDCGPDGPFAVIAAKIAMRIAAAVAPTPMSRARRWNVTASAKYTVSNEQQ
jgi:hypothetical protein